LRPDEALRATILRALEAQKSSAVGRRISKRQVHLLAQEENGKSSRTRLRDLAERPAMGGSSLAAEAEEKTEGVPPMSRGVECEFSVLGGLLMDNSRFPEVDIDPADFAIAQHRTIFEAIGSLIRDGKNADLLTVAEYLDRHEPGREWLQTIGLIVNNTPSAANVTSYAKIVKEDAIRRKPKA
jgi:hypothetical protein